MIHIHISLEIHRLLLLLLAFCCHFSFIKRMATFAKDSQAKCQLARGLETMCRRALASLGSAPPSRHTIYTQTHRHTACKSPPTQLPNARQGVGTDRSSRLINGSFRLGPMKTRQDKRIGLRNWAGGSREREGRSGNHHSNICLLFS